MNFRKLLKTRRHLASDSFVPMPQFQKRNIHQDDFSQRTQHRQSCKTQGCRCCIQNEISLIKSKNPNPSPTGKKFGFLMYGGDYGTRTCDLMRVKRRGAMPHGGRSNQQSFSTIFTVILEKSELFLEILS